MIDEEIYRQQHKKEFENKWMEKNRGAILHSMSGASTSSGSGSSTSSNGNALMDDDQQELMRERVKDKRLASNDPERYCADRCLSTGNCDVYEDLYVPLLARL